MTLKVFQVASQLISNSVSHFVGYAQLLFYFILFYYFISFALKNPKKKKNAHTCIDMQTNIRAGTPQQLKLITADPLSSRQSTRLIPVFLIL